MRAPRHTRVVKAIAYTISARKALRKLPAAARTQVEERLHRYATTGVGDVKRLVSRDGARLRVGDFRVIFVETAEAIEVRAVGDRRDVYR
jgi:mRNA interferase RelE/StbE